MSRTSAYDKAIQFIMEDPEYNICEITWWLGWGYTLQCWTVSNTTPTTFSHRGGEHFLFFSEMLFKWKDHVGHSLPRRMPTPGLVSQVTVSKIQPTNDEYNPYQVRHLRFIKLYQDILLKVATKAIIKDSLHCQIPNVNATFLAVLVPFSNAS